ncbi:MAG: hypothetical protein Q4E52_08125 [Fibrobacter sp.]|nr:hypothetical protein [Fibrobacter sp.]
MKIQVGRSLIELKSTRDMGGCPSGTVWSISNSVETRYWRETTLTSYIHHYDYKIHYQCNVQIVVEESEKMDKAKKGCEDFFPNFMNLCDE